ncbi:unnamed protein product [Rotaria magnacalcarata]|uniref:Uncharacterized protein n=1 Tax=Rotaria magnacalcarata TaxID=392030 RepID=A0A816WVX4_9BILA|nr:unnamed protein product [Rotaria magnacalcarata]
MSFTVLNKNLRKYDDRTLSDLLRTGLLDAADVEIDIEKCIEPELIQWLMNYDYDTSAQPIGIFFTLLTVLAHAVHNITILQWNKIRKNLNIYSLYWESALIQSTDVLVLQDEIDGTLNNMGFYSTGGNDGRQLLCSLWEGLDDNKRTKSYRQNIRRAHLTLCGASTGKSFTPLIRECLDDLPTDGVIDRCLILVVPYARFTRDLLKPTDLRKPTISQILMCASILQQRELLFDDDAYNTINAYTDDLTHRAAIFYRTSSQFTSYLAKQPAQVIKLCGLMTIIHIVVTVLTRININLSHDTDHGLTLALYNEIKVLIQQTVPYVITNDNVPQIRLTGDPLQKHIMREILMMRNLIIMTNAIFSIPGLNHVHRLLVKNALQQLVIEHLILADYYVLTSTNRPIFCYIKVVPKTNDLADQNIFVQKLEKHNISFEEYMILNNSYTLSKGSRLHQLAIKILSMPPYVALCGGPYDHHLPFEDQSIIHNHRQSDSYTSNIHTTQHHIPPQRSAHLSNRQLLQRTSTLNTRNKRSISTALIESNTLITNLERLNVMLTRNTERNALQNTYSISSISSQEMFQPILHPTDDRVARVTNSSEQQTNKTTTVNLLSHASRRYPTSFHTTSKTRKYTGSFVEHETEQIFHSSTLSTGTFHPHSIQYPDQIFLSAVSDNILENTNNDIIHSTDDNNQQASDINNPEAPNIIIETNDSIDPQQNNIESIEIASEIPSNSTNVSSTPQIQRLISECFPSEDNPFEEINSLNESSLNFRIRCKTIYKSQIRSFGTSSKVFDAIVCDLSGEIKVVAFNEDVDRLYNSMTLNQLITIQNGKIQRANEIYRSPYSLYEIRLISTSTIDPYVNHTFNPIMKIIKVELRQIPQKLHGVNVGKVMPYLHRILYSLYQNQPPLVHDNFNNTFNHHFF